MRDLLGDLEQFQPEEKDPVRRAQAAMKRPLPKRFYETAGIGETAEGFAILLDGKAVKTPARRAFVVPDRALADMVAAEWNAQESVIDPAAMPLTRMINSALDGVADAMEKVRAEIAAYAGSDLVCYRAEAPKELVERQAARWDPYLDYARQRLGAEFLQGSGVIPIAQPTPALDAIARRLAAEDRPLALGALHVIVSITGSVLMGLALADSTHPPHEVWQDAHVDEDWNVAQWGEDFEARSRRAARRAEFDAAVAVLFAAGRS